jgi:hypothetical protein
MSLIIESAVAAGTAAAPVPNTKNLDLGAKRPPRTAENATGRQAPLALRPRDLGRPGRE